MKPHPFDSRRMCCMFDADAPIHDTSQRVKARAENALREVCDASLQALSEEELSEAINKAANAAGAADQQWARLCDETSRRKGEPIGEWKGRVVKCVACDVEAEIGTEDVPHPVDRRIHTCVETPT